MSMRSVHEAEGTWRPRLREDDPPRWRRNVALLCGLVVLAAAQLILNLEWWQFVLFFTPPYALVVWLVGRRRRPGDEPAKPST